MYAESSLITLIAKRKMRSNFVTYVLLIAASCLIKGTQSTSNLYPRESVNREVKSLNGIWNFRTEPEASVNLGFEQRWFETSLRTEKHDGHVIDMPVPSSYNDITQSAKLRDYVGWVWYDRSFYAPQSWLDAKKTVLLRFDSVHHFAAVYLNGINVVNHTGGHLPFSCDVTGVLSYDKLNLVTVAVNNTLSDETVPQGQLVYKNDPTKYPVGFKKLNLNFDFFNYAGIHRSVTLYAVPRVHISDLTIGTSISDKQDGVSGRIDYSVALEGNHGGAEENEVTCLVDIFDKYGLIKIASSTGCNGTIYISNANLWWPIFTNPDPGYLYVGKIQLISSESKVVDTYEQKIGIREIKLTKTSFLINNQPFYFRGFGKHEDSNIRGKGLDLPLIVKDINLIKWIGANSFRTSHYPYSEELMDETDKHGIVVIDECPAVGLQHFGDRLLQNHLKTVTEMIHRDKNRPSVVMWSIANEPDSTNKAATNYFSKVSKHARALDTSRPISAAINADPKKDNLAQFLDMLMVNRYYAWYSDAGALQVISRQLVTDFDVWHSKFGKLMLISEYGADTVPGIHSSPSTMFTEDYQAEYLLNYFNAFDTLRNRANAYFVGELIWNFADFMTDQTTSRVYGNKKGIFTRERQPKASARFMRCRYLALANVTTEDLEDQLMYCPAPRLVSQNWG